MQQHALCLWPPHGMSGAARMGLILYRCALHVNLYCICMLQFHPILRDIYTSRGIKAIKQSFNEKANLSLAVDIPSVAAAALRHIHINAAAGFHIAAPFNIIVCADREKENDSARADRTMLSAAPATLL